MKKLQLIETNDCILAVSDEEIKEDATNLTNGRDVFDFTDVKEYSLEYANRYWQKIIAYQPKGDATELDLPLLPEIVVEDDYVEVKSKYKESKLYKDWTKVSRFLACGLQGVEVRKIVAEDDEALHYVMSLPNYEYLSYGVQDLIQNAYNASTKVYSEVFDFLEKNNYLSDNRKVLENEFIQSLKNPKTPKWFVAERTKVYHANRKGVTEFQDANGFYSWELKTQTINNKTYLVGHYDYK
jgi:hypothetical protein